MSMELVTVSERTSAGRNPALVAVRHSLWERRYGLLLMVSVEVSHFVNPVARGFVGANVTLQ
jgi:hypothetical protein